MRGHLLALFVACYALSVVLFFVTGRYRLPVVPVLLLFAACGVRALWHRPWPALAAFAALLVFCNAATGAMDQEGDAHEHYYLGYAYEERDMPAHAAPPLPPRHCPRPPTSPSHSSRSPRSTARPSATARPSTSIGVTFKTQPNDSNVRFLLGHTALLARRYDEPRPRTPRSQRCAPIGRPRTAASATPS